MRLHQLGCTLHGAPPPRGDQIPSDMGIDSTVTDQLALIIPEMIEALTQRVREGKELAVQRDPRPLRPRCLSLTHHPTPTTSPPPRSDHQTPHRHHLSKRGITKPPTTMSHRQRLTQHMNFLSINYSPGSQGRTPLT